MRSIVLFAMLVGSATATRAADDAIPPGMVLVPAGEFLMGADDAYADERPARRVTVSAFYIDRYEVTNAQFAAFVREHAQFDTVEGPWFRYSVEGCVDLIAHYQQRYGPDAGQLPTPERRQQRGTIMGPIDAARWQAAWAALRAMLGKDLARDQPATQLAARAAVKQRVAEQARLPVRGVSWRDAVAYARSVSKRLPTEAEWEKAARGTDGRRYPWGPNWDPSRCRTGLAPDAGPAPVGSFPQDASPYGCHDMAGNVWEWVADWYDEDYGASSESLHDPRGPTGLPDGQLPAPSADTDLLRTAEQGREPNTRKVVRGGGWSGGEAQARFNARCSRRFWSNPNYWHLDVGFRCAITKGEL